MTHYICLVCWRMLGKPDVHSRATGDTCCFCGQQDGRSLMYALTTPSAPSMRCYDVHLQDV